MLLKYFKQYNSTGNKKMVLMKSLQFPKIFKYFYASTVALVKKSKFLNTLRNIFSCYLLITVLPIKS